MADRPQKRLVVCFDGTWNNADDSGHEATNVERIARAIKGSSGDRQQIVLYLRGVGTTGTQVQQLLGGALGLGVEDNIRAAYQFLAQNYLPEREDAEGVPIPADEIFIFGFSRGAYTARSLAGFISISGLLKRQSLGNLQKAWDYYRDENRKDSRDFCALNTGADCHHEPEILFLGVWDTVGRLGIPATVLGFQLDQNYSFHDTEPSKIVRNAFHALAVDEKRDEFVPTLWTGQEPEGCQIDQVWFAGAHSDVGGGYEQRELADIPLYWMAERAEACGLALDWSVVDKLLPQHASLNPKAPHHESRYGFSRKDRFSPSYRRVCEEDFDPGWFASVVFPIDAETEKPLKTINESIHPVLGKRWDASIEVIHDDARNERDRTTYEPANLKPVFDHAGRPLAGRVWETRPPIVPSQSGSSSERKPS